MATRQNVSYTELRENVSAYLKLVCKEGVELLVTRYDKPIAVLTPIADHPRAQELIDRRLKSLGEGLRL